MKLKIVNISSRKVSDVNAQININIGITYLLSTKY